MSDASKVQNAYGAEQIQVLEGLEPVRKRPGMYIGTSKQMLNLRPSARESIEW